MSDKEVSFIERVLRALQSRAGFSGGSSDKVEIELSVARCAAIGNATAVVVLVEQLRSLRLLKNPHVDQNRATGNFSVHEKGREQIVDTIADAFGSILCDTAYAVINKLGGPMAAAEALVAKSEALE